ncbi:MAG: ATP-binding protein [Rhizobiaceae bacterium]
MTATITDKTADQQTSVPAAGQVDGFEDADGNFVTRNRTEGHVIECDGERAIIAADAGDNARGSDDYWAVGQLISVRVGESRIVGLIFQVDTQDGEWRPNDNNIVHIHIELVGEIRTENGKETFTTGIANYPFMGAVAHRIRASDLTAIYSTSAANSVQIGNLAQDASIPALISIDSLLSRHFAVVGTTGVGKSTAVTLLLRKIVTARPDIRILLLDPHNEFTAAFPEHAITIDSTTLELPFWMFQLDEFVEVIFRGRPPIPEEVDALRDFIPMAKDRYANENGVAQSALRKKEREVSSVTADTPVPYRMIDLIKLIQEREGQLDGKADRPVLRALKNRLEAILQDKRFRFMFQPKTPGDTLEKTISQIFRVPQNGKPVCVFEMSGLPSEVMNSVVSVLSRFAFDLAVSSDGSIPTLLVCEEAHRYIPADPDAGFWPTRAAIARIAKEGRKYGVFLSVITQRPGELDPTILSQCNSIFAMRLGNEHDKEIIRAAISGAAKSTTSFLSSIANREAIAFGEAVSTPMRMMFETVSREALPGSHIYDTQDKLRNGDGGAGLRDIIRRMRKQDEVHAYFDPDNGTMPGVAFVGEAVDDQKPSTERLVPDQTAGPARHIKDPPPLAAAVAENNTPPPVVNREVSASAAPTPRPAAPQPQPAVRQPQPASADHRPKAPSRSFGQDGYSKASATERPAEAATTSSRDERANDLIRSFRNR